MSFESNNSSWQPSSTFTSIGSQKSGSVHGASQPNSLFGNQSRAPFGNVSTQSDFFGSHSVPTFGSALSGAASMFGRDSSEPKSDNNQITSVFGYNTESIPASSSQSFTTFGGASTGSFFGNTQSSSVFGSTRAANPFGSSQVGPAFDGTQSSSTFGSMHQGSTFDNMQQGSTFDNKQSGSTFGSMQQGSTFDDMQQGSTISHMQPASTFGSTQPGSTFGNSQQGSTFSITQPGLNLDRKLTGSFFGSTQPGTIFGSSHSGSIFGSTLPGSTFGSTKPSSTFGSTQPGSTFGSAQPGSIFGSTQQGSTFGSTQPGPTFGSTQPGSTFGSTQPASTFGSAQPGPTFGSTQPGSTFGSTQPASTFGSTQPGSTFGSTQQASTFGSTQPASSFGSTQPGPTFGSTQPGSTFGSTQPASTFDSIQPASSFGSTQPGPTFGSTQPGSTFGSTQPASTFGSTQLGPTFGNTQPGSTFGSSHSGFLFGSLQAGPTQGTTQPSSTFGNSQSSSAFGSMKQGSNFGSTQQGFTFGEHGSTFGNMQNGSTFSNTQQVSSLVSTQQSSSSNSTQPIFAFGKTVTASSIGSTQPSPILGSRQQGSTFGSTQPKSTFGNIQPGHTVTVPSSIFGGTQTSSSFSSIQSNSLFSNVPSSLLSRKESVEKIVSQSSSFTCSPHQPSSHSESFVMCASSSNVLKNKAQTIAFAKSATTSLIGNASVSQQNLPFGQTMFSSNLPLKSDNRPSVFGNLTSPLKRPSQDMTSGFDGQADSKSDTAGKKSDASSFFCVESPSVFGNKTTVSGSLSMQPIPSTAVQSSSLFGNTLSNAADLRKKLNYEATVGGGLLFGKSASSNILKQVDEMPRGEEAEEPAPLKSDEKRSVFVSEDGGDIDTQPKSLFSNVMKTKGKLSAWSKPRNVPERQKRTFTEDESRESKKACTTNEQSSRLASPRTRLPSVQKHLSDLGSKTSLVVREIPDQFNKSPILRDHFSKFGKIARLQHFARSSAANVTFETHEQAAKAKNEGKYLSEDSPPCQLFWRLNSAAKSPEARKPKREITKRSPLKSAIGNTVDDELSSMAGSCDFESALTAGSSGEPGRAQRSRRRSPTPPPSSSVAHTSAPLPDSENIKELRKKIFGGKAKDTAGRIEILDARDKLLRILRKRQHSDLASAKAFSGTCPDMCPEKERYYREDVRRLALYEVIPSTLTSITGLKSRVDHSRAVKEYSRSSADQEEPLPHELRPLHVLVMTMTYLLSQVADQGEDGQWSEWYDFLWNRTRGIRKDITQQQLTDVQVAELIEKCARFHIVCSERLCEEDMMTFDAKINNENLTKCLQTLKEIYADLEKKQIYCPNEAEFRGYMVLMNLNEGDTLREIQQLRPEIRASEAVNFAVKAYNALNANNYVRFFRIIKGASFLNACILHRYFNQIRGKALVIIMKALNAINKNKIMYPVQELTRLLCFESDLEAREFCGNYCLNTEGSDVAMEAKAFLEPESSLPQRRANQLVEAKLATTLGEAINGGPLEMLHLPTPYSSFDEEGMFIMTPEIQDAIASSGQSGLKSEVYQEPTVLLRDKTEQYQIVQQTAETAPQPTPAELAKEKTAVANEVIKSLARNVILEVIDSELHELSAEVVLDHSVLLNLVDEIITVVNAEFAKATGQEIFDEEERKLKILLEEDAMKHKEQVLSAYCVDFVNNTVAELVMDVTCEEMRQVKLELTQQSLDRSAVFCSEDLLNTVVDNLVSEVSQQVYQVDVVAKRQRLDATVKCVELITCRKFLQFWKWMYISKIKGKRSMLDFPSAPSSMSVSEQIHRLVPVRPNNRITEKSFYVSDRAKLTIDSPMLILQEQLYLTTHLAMASAKKMLSNIWMWQPLDLSSILGPILLSAFQFWEEANVVDTVTCQPEWKLHVSLPDKQVPDMDIFLKWLRSKLCKNSSREEILESTPMFEGQVLSMLHTNEPRGKPLRLCVRCFQGLWTDNEEISVLKKDLLKGTSTVLFVTSSAEDLCSSKLQEATWKRDRRRLHQIFSQKRRSPPLALVIIVPQLSNENVISMQEVDECLGLSDLHNQKLISAVHLAGPWVGGQEQHLDNSAHWTSQLISCLEFAASHTPPPPKLRAKPVSDFVEGAVVEFYKAPVYQDLRARSKLQKLHQSPNTLLTLYNDVIEHVSMVAASSQLTDISWPAPEFDQNSNMSEVPSTWNKEEHLCDLYELIGKLRLPRFCYSDLDTEDWSVVCQDIWSYVNTLTKKDSGSAKLCLFQNVTDLLSQTKKNFDHFCWLANECGPCEPTYVNMVWTDLIDACIHYRLISLRTGHVTIRMPEKEEEDEETEQEDYVEPVVYYLESELADWQAPETWLDAQRDTELTEGGEIKSTVLKAKFFREMSMMENPGMDGLMQPVVRQPVTTQRPSTALEVLRDQFERERAVAARFEQTLESLLRNEGGDSAPLREISPLLANITPIAHHRHPTRSEAPTSDTFTTPYRKVDHSVTALKRASLPSVKLLSENQSPNTIDAQLSEPTVSQEISELKRVIQSQKEADLLFELNLQRLLHQ